MTSAASSEIKSSSLVYLSDKVRYEQVYSLNNFQLLDSTNMIEITSAVLNEILKKTDRLPNAFHSVFQSKTQPRLSVSSYLTRIFENFKCSQECLILSMIYIDRLTVARPKFVIRSTTIHKLMIIAIMLASKFLDDRRHKNEQYARLAGISTKELNLLEVDFLEVIGYDLYVDPILFFRYREQLLSQGKPLLRCCSSEA